MYRNTIGDSAIQNFLSCLASDDIAYDIPTMKRFFVNTYTSLGGTTSKDFPRFLLDIFTHTNQMFEGDSTRDFTSEEITNLGREQLFDFNKFFWSMGFQNGLYYEGTTSTRVPFYEVGALLEGSFFMHLPNTKYLFTIRDTGTNIKLLLKYDDSQEENSVEGLTSLFNNLSLYFGEMNMCDKMTGEMIDAFYQSILSNDIIGTNFDLYI